MRPSQGVSVCCRCGAELLSAARLADRARGAGLCPECCLLVPSRPAEELISVAYRVLATPHFRACAGNPADPESIALQALLDGIDAIEGPGPRHVVHCQACDAGPHNGLKHGTGPSLGAVGAPCQAPGCHCTGYRPCHRGPA